MARAPAHSAGSSASNASLDAAGGTAATAATAAAAGRPKVVVVTGPTAVGKTALSLQLARALDGEIISADSVQVYTGLDVGSDKLPVEQRQGIPHHLIDILPPGADFSAGDFFRLGRQATEDIISRGKVPIVVGGTGFYLRWLIMGRPTTPPSSPEAATKALQLIGQAWVRAAAEVAAGQQGAAALQPTEQHQAQQPPQQPPQQQQLQQQPAAATAMPAAAAALAAAAAEQLQQLKCVSEDARAAVSALSEAQRWDAAVGVVEQLGDAEAAARLRRERNNWYRLQRVLQILLLNGGMLLSEMDIDTTRELDYDFRCFFLHRPRLELYDRIAYRVEEMVAGGLLQEALMLLDQGMQPNSSIPTRAIGYRQACEFMQKALAEGGASTRELQQLILDIATASRNLVKHQTTWFRDEDMFRWLQVGGRSTDEVLQELLAELARPQHEGGCGDSGRLDKQELSALKRYVPTLKLFSDEARAAAALEWVSAVAAERQAVRGPAGPDRQAEPQRQ